ncbi:MAG TPA: glycoside hydrolase family 2 TIM barrel-domain containing protein [bacterium]
MKKIIITFLLVCLASVPNQCFADDIHFISQPEDSLFRDTYCWLPGNQFRPMILLDGEWEYRLSEKDAWKKVILPAASDYEGEITFRRFFTADSSLSRHIFKLVCYGINYYCVILINAKFVGSHSGGYSSFAFDIAEEVLFFNQKNVIEIKVDTRLSKHTIPQQFQPEGVQKTGGIYRSLYLLATPEFSLDNVQINSVLNANYSECDIDINFQIHDRLNDFKNLEPLRSYGSPRYQYAIEITALDETKSLVQEKNDLVIDSYQLTRSLSYKTGINKPELWSPESPSLYHLKIQLLFGKEVIDQVTETFGIKKLEIQNGNIYLNGTRLILKGINWIEDYRIAGALLDRGQLLKELELIKQLQANAIRVINHPPHPMLPALCDSLGLFLLQEIPLNWMPLAIKKSDVFVKHASDYLEEVIIRDRSRVSVFGWGIGGQFLFDEPETHDYISHLKQIVSNLENRPFYTWNNPPSKIATIDSNLIAGQSVFNQDKIKLQRILSRWVAQDKDQLKIVFSYGAPQLGLEVKNQDPVIFEEYQALKIVDAWGTVMKFPEIDGYFITALSDYQGNYPSSVLVQRPHNYLRPYGLTDYQHKKRLAFEAVRSLYQEGKYRYNPGLELKTEFPAIFPMVGIAAILIFLFLVNGRRYFRSNFSRIFIHPHGFLVDLRDGRKVPPSHTLFLALFVSIGSGLILASLLTFYKNYFQIDHLITLLFPKAESKTYISQLSWEPGYAVLFFSIVSFLGFLFMGVYFKLIAFLSGNRFSVTQSLVTPFWIAGNIILFVPIGTILYRILFYDKMIVPTLAVIALIIIWLLFRVMKGMRVIFTWSHIWAFFIFIISLSTIVGIVLYYYQANYGLLDYLKYYFQFYQDQIFTRAAS